MSKPQQQKNTSALLGLLGTVTATLAPLLIDEIAEALAYLGAPLDDEKRERLLKEQPSQIIQEAQVIGAAVELRQKREIAECVHENIRAEKATRSPGKGFLPS